MRPFKAVRQMGLVLLLWTGLVAYSSTAQAVSPWFKFNVSFVQSHYSGGEAFGTLTAKKWSPASKVHTIDCSGNDGELHVGAAETDLDIPSDQPPLSGRGDSADDSEWGLVADLPNASQANGPDLLGPVASGSVTFEGYYRVWNEGHSTGPASGSNPHHVFEGHPAWGFASGSTKFSDKALVAKIPGYSGYGASSFRALLEHVAAKKWPKVYQNDGYLFIQMPKEHNFFQLPVTVKSESAITGGHEVLVNVFTDKARTTQILENLRCITVDGSPIDGHLPANADRFLLGFFSVNLKRALDGSSGATSAQAAVAVPEALEFFVFGKATQPAVKSSDCTPED